MKRVTCDNVRLHNFLRRANRTFEKMRDVTHEVLMNFHELSEVESAFVSTHVDAKLTYDQLNAE